MSVVSSNNSLSRPMTTCLASLIRSGNSSSVMSTRPASESNFQTCSFSDSSSSLTALHSVLRWPDCCSKLRSSLSIRRFMPGLLEPEICVRQILVQLGPERLLPIPRIQPGLGHGNEPSLPGLSLILGNLIGPAPNWRLGAPHDLVLWYYSPILKNEISPHKSPPHLFEHTRFQTAEGFERDDLVFFWRPARSSAYLLCRGLHLLAPGGNLALIALFRFGFAADDLSPLCRWSRPGATRQDPVHGLLHH